MSMIEDLKWIRAAVADKEITARMSEICIHDGRVHAYSGRMWANRPFDCEESFAVNGHQFEQLVNRLEGPPKLKKSEDKITLSNGRRRGNIDVLPAEDWPYRIEWGQGEVFPEGLQEALAVIRPYISENATRPFALCVHIHDGHLFATNNIILIAVECPSTKDMDVLLPFWAIDFLLAHPVGLMEWDVQENCIIFKWNDGAIMRTSLVMDEFPELGRNYPLGLHSSDPIDFATDCIVEITPEWRRAFAFVHAIGDDTIHLSSTQMHSKNAQTEAVEDIGTPVPEGRAETMFQGKALELVLRTATHWNPTRFPRPVCFKGKGVQGLLSCMNKQ